MSFKAIFLDRDGVINVDSGYVHKIEDFVFVDGVFEALKLFQSNGFKLFVVTNQAGIARGYYTEKDFEILNNYMLEELEKRGIVIDEVSYCPHHPDGIHKDFSIKCECRKPNPGMIKKLIDKYDIDVAKSFMIGDKESDILAGIGCGLKTIRISDEDVKTSADFVVENLFESIKIIL